MSKSKQVEIKNQLQDEYPVEVTPPLVQDVRNSAMAANYDSLSEKEYLNAIWEEMKTMFSKCDFKNRRNAEFNPYKHIDSPYKMLTWPVVPSQLREVVIQGYDDIEKNISFLDFPPLQWIKQDKIFEMIKAEARATEEVEALAYPKYKTVIFFYERSHNMTERYGHNTRFQIKNAVIRAKFVGDESSHSFYIGEHDSVQANVDICQEDDKGSLLALLKYEGRFPESAIKEFALKPNDDEDHFGVVELEEFTMLAVTDGKYYKRYMEPRVVNEDLAIFTHYNKSRNLLCDTVASLKNGLCDPETIFTDDGTEDRPASWISNAYKYFPDRQKTC